MDSLPTLEVGPRINMGIKVDSRIVLLLLYHEPLLGPLVGVGVGFGIPESVVNLKKWQCCMSLPLIYPNVASRI